VLEAVLIVVALAIRLRVALRLARQHATTVAWKVTSPVIAPQNKRQSPVINAAKRATFPGTARRLNREAPGAPEAEAEAARSAIDAEKRDTSRVTAPRLEPPAMPDTVRLAAAAAEEEEEVQKPATPVVASDMSLGTAFKGLSAITALARAISAVIARSHRGVLATRAAPRGISPVIAPTQEPARPLKI